MITNEMMAELEEYLSKNYRPILQVGDIVRHKAGDMFHDCKITKYLDAQEYDLECDYVEIVPTGDYGFPVEVPIWKLHKKESDELVNHIVKFNSAE